MKRTINNPYSVNNKFYGRLLGLSFISIIIFCCPYGSLNFVINEVMKNISYGYFASILVAWLIEMTNVKEKNKKAEEVYVSTYKYLYIAIYRYISTWAEICHIVFNDNINKEEIHTWKEWYVLARDYFETDERKARLFVFYNDRLEDAVESVNVAINYIYAQRPVLTVNDLYNSDLERVIEDFRFEVYKIKAMLDSNSLLAQKYINWQGDDRFIKEFISVSSF